MHEKIVMKINILNRFCLSKEVGHKVPKSPFNPQNKYKLKSSMESRWPIDLVAFMTKK